MPLKPSFRDKIAATGHEAGLKNLDRAYGRKGAEDALAYAEKFPEAREMMTGDNPLNDGPEAGRVAGG